MGIIVEWDPKKADPGTEYIDDIDLDNLEDCPAQMQTEFWSPDGDGGEFIRWNVEVRVERPTDDRTVLVVKYDEEQNPEITLDPHEGYWGKKQDNRCTGTRSRRLLLDTQVRESSRIRRNRIWMEEERTT